MPSLLLINADRSLFERLLPDRRWNLAFGAYVNQNYNVEAPDPKQWDLIIDDSDGNRDPKKTTNLPDEGFLQQIGVPRHLVSTTYLRQATRSVAIRLASEQQLGVTLTSSADQFSDVEFNPTQEREATNLVDFLHRFRSDFQTRCHLSWKDYIEARTLFHNAYDSPLVTLDEYFGHPTLTFIDIPDGPRRAAALEYLCVRTAPKLWPQLYSGSFHSRKIQELSAVKEELIRESAHKIKEIDDQIEREESYMAPYIAMLYIGDDALKNLTMAALRDIFGFNVTDLDETQPGPKTADLLLQFEDWQCLVEVSGSTNRNAGGDDLDDFDEHADRLRDAGVAFDSRLLIFNGRYRRSEEDRLATPTFSHNLVREAKKRDVSLLDTFNLLHAIELRREDALSTTDLVKAIRDGGVLQFQSSQGGA